MHDSVAWQESIQGGNNALEHVMSVRYENEEQFSHLSHLKRAGHGEGRRESATGVLSNPLRSSLYCV